MKRLLPAFLALGFILTSFSSFGQIRNYTTQQAPLPCLNKEFSVVLHTVVDSFGMTNIEQANIDAAFADLNAAFEPICASFTICEERTIKNFQYDQLDSLEQWEEILISEHQPNRINVFLVFNTILGQESPAEEAGLATQNGIQSLETGGIVAHKRDIDAGSKTLTHLFGHYFGLIHTFEGNGAELVDGSNCTTEGDLICDTPADNFVPNTGGPFDGGYLNPDPNIMCRYIDASDLDDNDEPYRPDVGNFMSYYFDITVPVDCRCGFSYEQYNLMAKNYLDSSPKMW